MKTLFHWLRRAVEQWQPPLLDGVFPVVSMRPMLEVTWQGHYLWKKPAGSRRTTRRMLSWLCAPGTCIRKRQSNRAGIERILWDLQEEGHVTSECGARPPGAALVAWSALEFPAVGVDDCAGQQGNRRSGRPGWTFSFNAPESDSVVGRRDHLYLDVLWLRVPGDAYSPCPRQRSHRVACARHHMRTALVLEA